MYGVNATIRGNHRRLRCRRAFLSFCKILSLPGLRAHIKFKRDEKDRILCKDLYILGRHHNDLPFLFRVESSYGAPKYNQISALFAKLCSLLSIILVAPKALRSYPIFIRDLFAFSAEDSELELAPLTKCEQEVLYLLNSAYIPKNLPSRYCRDLNHSSCPS